MVFKRKLFMFLVLSLVIVGAVGAGSHLIGACDFQLPPSPPC